MEARKSTRGALPLLVLSTYFLFFFRKYSLPEVEFFVPNVSFLKIRKESGKDPSSSIKRFLKEAIDVKFVTSPKVGWLFSFKEKYGIRIPVRLLMPAAFPIAIWQIKSQIDEKVEVKPKKAFGVTYGYRVKIGKITFWC